MIFENSSLQQTGIYQYGLIETNTLFFQMKFVVCAKVMFAETTVRHGLVHLPVGTISECKEKCLKYDMALVLVQNMIWKILLIMKV